MAKYHAILGQLLLRDWTVVKVMATAIVVGSAGVYALVSLGSARLDVWPFVVVTGLVALYSVAILFPEKTMRATMRITSLSAVLLFVPLAGADADGWVKLFDGKTLGGWEQRNGTASYRVEGGSIVGKTSEGSPNSFLCTVKEYGDFELTFEVKVDDALNSGVQIRSKTKDNKKENRVHGPQVEISIDGNAGRVWGESLPTGWLDRDTNVARTKTAFKKGEWNSYRVLTKGKSIKTWINGMPVADCTDDKTNMPSGFIGLQVHGIGKGTGPYEVRWRNLLIKEPGKPGGGKSDSPE